MTEQEQSDPVSSDSEPSTGPANHEHGGTFDKAKQATKRAVNAGKAKFEEAGGLDGLREKGQKGVLKSKELADKGIGMAKQKFEDAGGVAGLENRSKAFTAEVKAGFIPDEGTAGFKRVLSRVTNLWRSGRTGKLCVIFLSLVAIIVITSL